MNGADATGDFLEKYKSTYDKDPQMAAPNTYDALKLIVEGFERAGKDASVKPTTEEAAKAISEIKDFPGALGTLSVGEDGIVWSGAVVRIIQDGKPVTVK